MKKIILAIFATILAVGALQAQDVFSKGEKVANLGIGFGSYLGGSGYSATIPPISASVEFCIIDGLIDGNASIGVGGYLSYSANKWNNNLLGFDYGYKYSYFVIGPRGAFHYQFIDKLDTYAGVMLGYNVVSASYYGDDLYETAAASSSGVWFGGFAGARYYFTPTIAVFAEVGYGVAAIELGVSLKF
jgi:hypothetical protein